MNQLLYFCLSKKSMAEERKLVLTREVAAQKIRRLALEVAEHLSGEKTPLLIIGIRDIGYDLAKKIAALLPEFIHLETQIISATIDKVHPAGVEFSEVVDFNQKNILLIDDVCNSGKTLLYTLKPILSAYPKRVQVLVLLERMHKLFPIKPDYVGLSLATAHEDFIQVQLDAGDFSAMLVSR